uniref:Uncharacterized protein n=2 Tax=Parascaris univalens TaxID=6257 RepID=A0A915ABM8_PARUN
MVGEVKEKTKVEMDPETSVSFDLSLAASHEFHRRRKRILENMSNFSLLTTKSFGGNTTLKRIRSLTAKSVEWEERLKRFADVVSNFDKNCPERMKEVLNEGFKDLSAVLIQISTSKRPLCVFQSINAFAIALVKLQQWRSNNGYEEGDELIADLVHKTLGYWLNARTHFNEWDRAWAHTRTVLVDMLRNITSVKTIINVKHLIASMLTELLSYTAKEGSYAHGVYASEQLEHLESILTQQLYRV